MLSSNESSLSRARQIRSMYLYFTLATIIATTIKKIVKNPTKKGSSTGSLGSRNKMKERKWSSTPHSENWARKSWGEDQEIQLELKKSGLVGSSFSL